MSNMLPSQVAPVTRVHSGAARCPVACPPLGARLRQIRISLAPEGPPRLGDYLLREPQSHNLRLSLRRHFALARLSPFQE
jgi:hypothetical protein